MSLDKKEKAMDFGIRLLDSLNYLLTLTLIAILFVSGLFYYIHRKYGREQEPNPPETAAPVIATPEPVSLNKKLILCCPDFRTAFLLQYGYAQEERWS